MSVLLAAASLVALPFAGLVVAARPGTGRERLAAALAGGAGVALLLSPERGLLDGFTRAWILLVSVAFSGGAALRPARFWPLALRACLYAAAAIVVLARALAGPAVWQELQWDATRAASAAVQPLVQFAPPLYPLFEAVVRVLGSGWPVWLLLETLAGLALAWQGHARVARTPLGHPHAGPHPRPERGRTGARAPAPTGAVLNH